MNELLLVGSAVLMALGIIGCVFPVVPGPPLSYVALVMVHFSGYAWFSVRFFVIFGIVTALVAALDYLVPIWGTRKFGGSRSGAVGAAVGMVLGLLFFPPAGLVIGTFAGAFVGELVAGKSLQPALRSSLGALLGFLAGTVIKVLVAGLMLFYYIKGVL